MKPAIHSERSEAVSSMEPLLIGSDSPHLGELTDLAVELAQKSSAFRHSLPPNLVASLAQLVRAMNCYYSNFIEGHNTHPIDIERALKNEFSTDKKQRDLQLEAKAHIAVQQWVDTGGLHGGAAVTVEGIRELHRRFCEQLPEDLLWVEYLAHDAEAPSAPVRVTPGELRTLHVRVGRHEAISPGAIPRFLARFESGYGKLGKASSIVAGAAMHHRLLWIHPFLDGNGRVARLMSHAVLLETLDTGSLWSISRGLARSVHTYKEHLTRCDQQRRNDLDGRGNLSEHALVGFTQFFLQSCLDQVQFMESLIQPDRLRTRIALWAEEEIQLGNLPIQSGAILQALLLRGELPRGDAQLVTGKSERQTNRIVAGLIGAGVVTSASSRAPLRLAFPARLAGRWLPGLFPEH